MTRHPTLTVTVTTDQVDWLEERLREQLAEADAVNTGHQPLVIDARLYLRRLLVRHPDDRPRFDLVIADPPCTPYSHAGKRLGMADPRDGLVVTCAIIEALRPTAWLIANVPGLEEAHGKGALEATIYPMAERLGMVVDFIRTDCADYGIPQHRKRPWWFGRPKGSRPIKWPKPTHGPDREHPWVTVAEALEGAGFGAADNWGRRVEVVHKPRHHVPRADDRPSATATATVTGGRQGLASGKAIMVQANHPISKPDAPGFTITTKHSTGGQCVEWPWARPSTTTQADNRIGLPGHHDPAVGNAQHGTPDQAIVLHERALRVLQGVPPTWCLGGTTATERRSQLGQMMPPGMAKAIGRSIVHWFRFRGRRVR